MCADNHTPLNHAVLNGDTAAMAQLLVNGASVEAMDRNHNTLLHLAVQNGHSAMVELLLSYSASTEAMDDAITLLFTMQQRVAILVLGSYFLGTVLQ